jgi:hypothetical protein
MRADIALPRSEAQKRSLGIHTANLRLEPDGGLVLLLEVVHDLRGERVCDARRVLLIAHNDTSEVVHSNLAMAFVPCDARKMRLAIATAAGVMRVRDGTPYLALRPMSVCLGRTAQQQSS